MSKRNLLFLLFFALLFNCSVTEKPEFVGLEKVQVLNTTSQFITLSADAVFINKNDVGGRLKTDDLKVYINDTEVATIVSDEFDVPSKEQFKIPLTVAVSTDSLTNNKSLGGLLSSLISQRLKVTYKGDIEYNILGYSSSYTVDESQELKIKL
jgi:hypothetical protein